MIVNFILKCSAPPYSTFFFRFVESFHNTRERRRKSGKKCLSHPSPGFVLGSIHSHFFAAVSRAGRNCVLIWPWSPSRCTADKGFAILLQFVSISMRSHRHKNLTRCLVFANNTGQMLRRLRCWNIWNAFSRTFNSRHGRTWIVWATK